MFDLDQSIAEWRRQMEAGGITDPEVLNELEIHMRDEIEQQMKLQVGVAEAYKAAVHRIGNAARLQSEFENTARAKATQQRRALWRAFGLSAAVIVPCVAGLTYVLFPQVLRSNESYELWLGKPLPNWRAQEILGFLCRFVAGIGYCVAMPVCLFSLAKVGVMDWRKLANLRRYVLVVHLILAAVITTPQVLTQIMMFIPLQLLFEAAVLSAWIWERRTMKDA